MQNDENVENIEIIQNTKILEEYRDRCYVCNILCQKSCDFYGKLKLLISLPLIILSSIMTILNSSELNRENTILEKTRGIQIANIILNTFTIFLISLNNTFKLSEKQSNFRVLSVKFNKLCHIIEDNLYYSVNTISPKSVFELIIEYDNLNEALEYSFPEHIKTKVKNIYKNTRTLPNILNCETDFTNKLDVNISPKIQTDIKTISPTKITKKTYNEKKNMSIDSKNLSMDEKNYKNISIDTNNINIVSCNTNDANSNKQISGEVNKKKISKYHLSIDDTNKSPYLNHQNDNEKIFDMKYETPFVKHPYKKFIFSRNSTSFKEVYNENISPSFQSTTSNVPSVPEIFDVEKNTNNSMYDFVDISTHDLSTQIEETSIDKEEKDESSI